MVIRVVGHLTVSENGSMFMQWSKELINYAYKCLGMMLATTLSVKAVFH